MNRFFVCFCCRGLYSLVDWNAHWLTVSSSGLGRGLYSLVDWNISYPCILKSGRSRGLYSLVDWNTANISKSRRSRVEAYTASWIEIASSQEPNSCSVSRLIQPRGLKSPDFCFTDPITSSRLIQPRGLKFLQSYWYRRKFPCRGLYSLVDWNLPYGMGIFSQ